MGSVQQANKQTLKVPWGHEYIFCDPIDKFQVVGDNVELYLANALNQVFLGWPANEILKGRTSQFKKGKLVTVKFKYSGHGALGVHKILNVHMTTPLERLKRRLFQ